MGTKLSKEGTTLQELRETVKYVNSLYLDSVKEGLDDDQIVVWNLTQGDKNYTYQLRINISWEGQNPEPLKAPKGCFSA